MPGISVGEILVRVPVWRLQFLFSIRDVQDAYVRLETSLVHSIGKLLMPMSSWTLA